MVRFLLDLTLAIGKILRPNVALAWTYLKFESAPPYTISWLHGIAGRNMERAIAGFVDTFLSGLEKTVQGIDAAKARKEQAKIDAIRMAQEQAKAEAETKAKEARQQAEEAAKKAAPKSEAKPEEKKDSKEGKK